MASGGSVWLGSKPNIQFTVSYSVTRNLSSVSISLSCDISGVSGASYYGYPLYGTPTINGSGKSAVTLKNASPSQWSAYSTSLGSYTTTVSNLAQTSMPVSVYFSGNGKSATLSFSATLPNVSPSTISSSVDFVIGNNLPVSISRASNSFTHSIKATIAGTDIHTWTGIGASTTLDLSTYANTIYALIPNANTAPVKLTLTTFSGSTTIGSTSRDGTASASAAACKPTFAGFTLSNSDINLTGDANTIIPGQSNLTLTISTPATANKSATMKSYFATCGDKSASAVYSTGTVTMTLSGVNSNTVSVQAIDSRGNSTTVSKTLYVLDYTQPAIGSVSFQRDNAVEVTGKLSYSGKWWNKNFGAVANAIQSATWRYRLTGASTWTNGTTSITPTVSGDTFSFSGYITPVSGGWNSDNSYEIQITIRDRIGLGTLTGTINVGVTAIDVRRSGSKYYTGFGKIPDVANMPYGGIDVAGEIYTQGANATDVVLECKNLLNYESYANTVNVVSGTAVWENNGVKLTATAEDCYTAWRGTYQFEVPVEVGKKYILSWEENTNASGLVIIFPNATTTGAVSINNANGKSITYTAASGVTFITFRFGVANSGTTIAYKNIMIREASITDDSYVPYAMTNRQLTENTQDIADKIKSFYVVPFGVGSSYDSIRITFTDNGQKSMFLYGYTINNQTLGAISYYRGSDNLNFVTSIGAFNIQQKTDSVANSLIINTGRYGTGFLLVNAPCTVSNLNW